MTTPEQVCRRFIDGVAARDYRTIEAQLAPELKFRGLTPPALREATTPAGASAWFERWFSDATEYAMVSSSVEPISDRVRFSYRLELVEDGAAVVMEQYGFCAVEDDRITALDLVCSGSRPR